MSVDPLRNDIGASTHGGRELTQRVPGPGDVKKETATIVIRDDLEPTTIAIETATRHWDFVVDQRTASLTDGDAVPDWMEHLLAHFGIKEVDA